MCLLSLVSCTLTMPPLLSPTTIVAKHGEIDEAIPGNAHNTSCSQKAQKWHRSIPWLKQCMGFNLTLYCNLWQNKFISRVFMVYFPHLLAAWKWNTGIFNYNQNTNEQNTWASIWFIIRVMGKHQSYLKFRLANPMYACGSSSTQFHYWSTATATTLS